MLMLSEDPTMLQRIRERVAECERRHGIATADVHAAIEERRLVETLEVCTWLMDADLLARLDGQEVTHG